MQNGFCTNFPILRQKLLTEKPKNVPKNAPKNAPKNEMFSPNFSSEIFLEFLVCVFFCSKNSKCDRKMASKKFGQKIQRGTEQNPECRCGRGGSLSTCPFEKQKLSRKTENFFSSGFCTSLPSKNSLRIISRKLRKFRVAQHGRV